MSYSVSYIFQAMDNFSPQVAKMSGAVNSFNANISKTAGQVKKHFSKMENLAAGAAVGLAAAIPVKDALEFDKHMTSVRKQISGLDTPEALKDIEKFIKESGVKFAMSANDMADLVAEGAKAGVLKKDMTGYVEIVGALANAFDMSAGSASEMVGSIQARLGMSMGEIDKFTDYVNYLDDRTNASGANMLDIISRTSGVMKTIHMPPNLIAGFAAFADRIETSPELAASGFGMMIGKMQEIPSINKQLLTGDPEATIRKVLGGLAEMPEVERSGKIVEMFGLNAKHFVEKAVTSLKLYDETMGLAKDSTSALGSKQREMAARAQSASFQFEQMQVQMKNISITVGAAFLPVIKQLAPIVADLSAKFSAFAETHSRFLKFIVIFGLIMGAVAAVAAVVAVLVMAFGGLGAAITAGVVVAIAAVITLVSEGSDVFSAFGGVITNIFTYLLRKVELASNAFIEIINIITGGWNLILSALGIDFQIPMIAEFAVLVNSVTDGINFIIVGWNKLLGVFGAGITIPEIPKMKVGFDQPSAAAVGDVAASLSAKYQPTAMPTTLAATVPSMVGMVSIAEPNAPEIPAMPITSPRVPEIPAMGMVEQPITGIGMAAASAKTEQQNVNVGGEIIVKAVPGAEIVSKKTEFSTGKNVPYGQ